MLTSLKNYINSLGVSEKDTAMWTTLFTRDLESGQLSGKKIDGRWYVLDESNDTAALDLSSKESFSTQLKQRAQVAVNHDQIALNAKARSSNEQEQDIFDHETSSQWLGYDDGVSTGQFSDLKGGVYSRENEIDGQLRDCFGRRIDEVNNW